MRDKSGERFRWSYLVWSAVVFVVAMVVYGLTVQRGVSWQDSGIFQHRILTGTFTDLGGGGLAVVHPWYLKVGRWFCLCFPASQRVMAVNLFSGVGAAVALAVLMLLGLRLTRGRVEVALAAVVSVGVAQMMWWLATIAEVYTWSLAFLFVEVLVLVWICEGGRRVWYAWPLLMVVNGMHASLHNVALLNLPVYGVVWLAAGRASKGFFFHESSRMAYCSQRSDCNGEGKMAGSGPEQALGAPRGEKCSVFSVQCSEHTACRVGGVNTAAATGCVGNETRMGQGVNAMQRGSVAWMVVGWVLGGWWLVEMVVGEWVRSGDLVGTVKSWLVGTGFGATVMGVGGVNVKLALSNIALGGVSFMTPCFIFALWAVRGSEGGKVLRRALAGMLAIQGFFWVRYFVPDQATFVLPTLGLAAVWMILGAQRFAPRVVVAALLVGVVTQVGVLPLVLPAVEQRVSRVRELPFRDEGRYWLLPWKHNEESAQRFVEAVDGQLGAGDILVGDLTALNPVVVARAAGELKGEWRLVSDWSGEGLAEVEEIVAGTVAGGGRVYAVSPIKGYIYDFMLERYDFEQEGVLWRVRSK